MLAVLTKRFAVELPGAEGVSQAADPIVRTSAIPSLKRGAERRVDMGSPVKVDVEL